MGRVDGKVALVTGGARGQGRAHAIELAKEGADIVILDICEDLPGYADYKAATQADLDETARMIEELGRNVIPVKGDVRSLADVEGAVRAGIDRFGYIDVAVINHGIAWPLPYWEYSEEEWQTSIDINLTGPWRVAKALTPQMIEAERGGSIMFTSSVTGVKGHGNMSVYSAAKTGLLGLTREMAIDLGPYGIRVNAIVVTGVQTEMFDQEGFWKKFTPDMEGEPLEDRRARFLEINQTFNILPVPYIQPEDVAKGVLFLASDDSKMVTGGPFRIDAGSAAK